MFRIVPYVRSVSEMKEFVWLLACVWVKKLKLSLFLFPSKIGWADFARIVHKNSTPRRNHIFWAAFEYLYPFCIYGGGVEFSVFSYTLVMVSNTAYCTTVHTREYNAWYTHTDTHVTETYLFTRSPTLFCLLSVVWATLGNSIVEILQLWKWKWGCWS